MTKRRLFGGGALFLLVLAGILCTMAGRHGGPSGNAFQDLNITSDRFVSLTFNTKGGIGDSSAYLTIREGNIELRKDLPPEFQSQEGVRKLSKNEMDSLFKLLTRSRFPMLVGQYDDHDVFDAFYEVMTLTLRENGVRKSYTVHNYGDTKAPKNYYVLRKHIYDLCMRKYNSAPDGTVETQ